MLISVVTEEIWRGWYQTSDVLTVDCKKKKSIHVKSNTNEMSVDVNWSPKVAFPRRN